MLRFPSRSTLLRIAPALVLAPSAASAAVVPADVVLQQGETPVGAASPVDSIGSPFAEASGAVGVGGGLESGERFVFRGDQVIFLDSSEMTVSLSGIEASLGTAPGDLFIYSPSIDGADGLYTDAGVLPRSFRESAPPSAPAARA